MITIEQDVDGPPSRFANWARRATFGAVMLLLVAVISCSTVHRSVVVLPQVPGLKYIGSKECEQCHEQICRDFVTADHARLMAAGTNALAAGCESCHGPCSAHSESGGETLPPYSFAAGRPQASSYGAAIALPTGRSTETMCYQCHGDVRGQFSLADHHPVPEGKMSWHRLPFPAQGFDPQRRRHVPDLGERHLHPLPLAAAGPVRVRARGRAGRLHHLPHAPWFRERKTADRARREPVHEMPFPAGERRGDFDRRLGPYAAAPARHVLDGGLS